VLGRYEAVMVLIHTEIGLGILSLPSVCETLGLIPALIAILGIELLATYTAYLFLQFWRKHQDVDNVADLLRVLGGKPWGIIGSVAWILNITLTCASASLTTSVAFNTLSGHSMCTVAFVDSLSSYATHLPFHDQ
jgi:amino acid permease